MTVKVWLASPGFRPGTSEYVTAQTNKLRFFDVTGAQARLNREIPLRGESLAGVFDGTGRHVFVAHTAGLDWHDVTSGETRPVPAPGTSVIRIAVNGNGSLAAYAARGPAAEWTVWTTSHFHVLAHRKIKAQPTDVALHPEEPVLAISFVGGDIELWNLEEDKLLHRLPESFASIRPQFHGSDRIVACCKDDSVRIWDWRLGQELLRLGSERRINSYSFSANGLALATASYDPAVTIRFALPWWFEEGTQEFYRDR